MWFLCNSSLSAPGPAVSGGTVGPLSLGEGELICTLAPRGVENPDVPAPVEIQGVSCHPTSMASFSGDRCCVTLLPSASQAESICDFSEDGAVVDYLMPAVPATTSGVTEVVAMAEVSVTHPSCMFVLHYRLFLTLAGNLILILDEQIIVLTKKGNVHGGYFVTFSKLSQPMSTWHLK